MPKMSKDHVTLSEPDVRAIVRLLGEVAALQGDHAAKKRALMDGLCRLIGADYWGWGLAMTRSTAPLPRGLVLCYSTSDATLPNDLCRHKEWL